MYARDFLQKIIEEIPSRGLDDTRVYIHCRNPEDKNEVINFEIEEITNNGDNDALFLVLSPSKN